MLFGGAKRHLDMEINLIGAGGGWGGERLGGGSRNSARVCFGIATLGATVRIGLRVLGRRGTAELDCVVGPRCNGTGHCLPVAISTAGVFPGTRHGGIAALFARANARGILAPAVQLSKITRIGRQAIDYQDAGDRIALGPRRLLTPAGRINIGWNAWVAIERRLRFGRSGVATKLRSSNGRRTQNRCDGIQRVPRIVKLPDEQFAAIRSMNLTMDLSRKRVHEAADAHLVDLRSRVVRNAAMKSHFKLFQLLRPQTSFDRAQSFVSVGLCESRRHSGTVRTAPQSYLRVFDPRAPVKRGLGSTKRGGAGQMSTGGCEGSVSGSTPGSWKVRRISATERAGS